MLDLAPAPLVLAGLVLFRDHADPDLFHATTTLPRVPSDGGLRFSLDLYRGDTARGGLLQLEVTLDPTDAQLEAALADLRASGHSGARIVPVDWVSGETWLAGRIGDEGLNLQVGKPGTGGSTTVVIAVRLAPELAALVAASLRGEAVPMVIGYSLTTLGLSAPLSAEVDADLGLVHDAITAQGGLLTPVARARIAHTTEELVKSGAVRVRVVDASGNADTTRAEAIGRFGQDLVQGYFTPVPITPQVASLDPAMANVELQFKLTMQREQMSQTAHWSYRERTARHISHFASSSLVGLLGGAPWTSVVREHDLVDETAQTSFLLLDPPDLLRPQEVTVEVRGDETSASRVIRLTLPERFAQVPMRAGSYRVTTRFAAGLLEADPTTDWLPMDGRTAIALDLRALHGLRTSRFELLSPDSGVRDVTLFLEGVLEQQAERTLAPGRPVSVMFRERAAATWRPRYHFEQGCDDVDGPTQPVTDGLQLVVPPTVVTQVRVLVVAVPGLEQVVIAASCDAGLRSWASLELSATDAHGGALELVVPRDTPQAWSWRATLLYADGRVDVQEGPGTAVIVLGAPGGARTWTVEALVSSKARGLLAIEVRLRVGSAEAQATLTDDALSTVLAVPVTPDLPTEWSMDVLGYRADGTISRTKLTGDGTLVVLPMEL